MSILYNVYYPTGSMFAIKRRMKHNNFFVDSIHKYFISFNQMKIFSFCLFVWCFSSHSKIFNSYGDVTIAGERLQIVDQ